jgi:hypothetical protein
MVGAFSPENIELTGLTGDFTTSLVIGDKGIALIVSGDAARTVVDTTIDVVLSPDGFDPIVTGDLVIDGNGGLAVDGSKYIAGPASLKLLDLTTNDGVYTRYFSRLGTFDPMKVKLSGFAPGLWFRLTYNDYAISLEISDISDYSIYNYWDHDGYTKEAVYQEQEPNGNFPDFSWDTVPRYLATRKPYPFTDDELAMIVHSEALIVSAGHATTNLAVATRLKELNPSIKTWWYWNSALKWGYSPFYDTFDDEWLLYEIDENGDRSPIRGSGYTPRFIFNHSIPEMRQWWVDSAVTMLSEESIDGIFVDKIAVGMSPPQVEMVNELASVLPKDKLYLGNALRQKSWNGSRDRLAVMEGSYMENMATTMNRMSVPEALSRSIQLAREALSKGKIILIGGAPHGPSSTPEEVAGSVDYPLARFLMIADEHAYFGYSKSPKVTENQWEWDSSYIPAFRRHLGNPLGPPIQIGNTFTRSFENLEVQIDLATSATVFNWHNGTEIIL